MERLAWGRAAEGPGIMGVIVGKKAGSRVLVQGVGAYGA